MWLRLITLSLQALTGLVAFLRERQLLAAGRANAERDAEIAAAKARLEIEDTPEPEDAELIRRLRNGKA